MSEDRQKLCYILPKYDPDTDTHFAYLYKLIKRTQDEIEYFLIVEKASKDPKALGAKHTYTINNENYLIRLFSYLRLLVKAYRKDYKDVYIHYSYVGALAAIFITAFTGGRVFYWNCGMLWFYKRSWFRESMFRFILSKIILVTGTQSLAKEYAKRYGLKEKNTRVFPNWIDVDEFQNRKEDKKTARKKLDISQEKDVVLFIHHLSKRKGADKIIPTAERMPETQFIVLGDGPLLDKLKSYNGTADVRVEGKVPHKKIYTYLSTADVFFMPSEEEGFPHVLLEAMAVGLPFVATDVGGVRDIRPDFEKEYIIKERTPENFARALKDLQSNPLSSSNLVNYTRRKYDFSITKPKFTNLFT
jgi:glycosyltransferase involved in cell wall biosynthesis